MRRNIASTDFTENEFWFSANTSVFTENTGRLLRKSTCVNQRRQQSGGFTLKSLNALIRRACYINLINLYINIQKFPRMI